MTTEQITSLAQPAPELDGLLAPHATGYAGADVGMSIPLPDGRTLWLFGDTLVGTCSDGARDWDQMPQNTIAIQPAGPPDAASVQWHFKNREGMPATFFRLPPTDEGEWYWPGTGAMIDGRLFLFGYGVVPNKGECEALNFRVVRSWLVTVADTSGDPLEWSYDAEPIGWDAGGASFSSACFRERDFLYLLGLQVREGCTPSRVAVLARVRVHDLLARGAGCKAEYLSGPADSPAWSHESNRLTALFAPGVTECSVFYDAPRARYIATTYTAVAPELLFTTALAIEGPWSEPIAVYHCPQGDSPGAFLFYTFRMHPQLASHSDEMIFSYVVNARDPADLKRNTSIYYPRFIRLDLRET